MNNYTFKKQAMAFAFFLLVTSTRAFAQTETMHMGHQMDNMAKSHFLLMMDNMMVDMDRAEKGQSADAEFLLQMVPHHQCAVTMAKYEIAHGKNPEMIQLAKSILAEQKSEITQMGILLKQLSAGTAPISKDFYKGMQKSMDTMMANLPGNSTLGDVDHAFAKVMLPHHQAAIDMAKAVLAHGNNQQARAFALLLVSNQQIEIQQMSTYLL